MIKLCKWLYLNPLTVVLFILCFITRKLEFLVITYVILFAHECTHLLAAVFIGLKPAYIAFHPFGINLKLKNRLIYALSDEIILYLSGPLCNIVLAGICALLYTKLPNFWLKFAYIQNILLFAVNMMPIIPLDGGVIVKKILLYKMGYKKADITMIIISCIFIGSIIFFGARVFWQQRNFSALFLLLFMIGNIFTQKEKYNIDFIKELMFYQEKGKQYHKQNVKLLISNKDTELHTLAKNFNIKDFFIIFFLSADGEIDDIVTETQIIHQITHKGNNQTKRLHR